MRYTLRPVIFPLLLGAIATPGMALDRPWIADTFFYWYTWDYAQETGDWMGQGVHNTPLEGYYDSRTFRDNRRSLHTASEWGLTHHFMDYWAPDWKGEGGEMREAIVMRAAESLRREGYDIWMSYYQDGQNFEMADFARNVSEKRDVYQWLRDFARSPVWPKIDGQPLQLVYGRNGTPKTTLNHAGFRRFLIMRYGSIAALNRAWGSNYRDFDQIEMTFGGRGHLRASSIEYQYRIWEEAWEKLNGLVKKEFGFPGMRASFDVGYHPYMDFGFADYARVFGGPHSYGGIFGPPDQEDVERYIHASMARKYNTVFFDHFKNYYFDWDIRVPGTAFLPDPYCFDRFWVGALARRSEALLHLSWNEWWEGSNLEPSREFGKTFCEKNLFYATLMKLAFASIHNAEREAKIGVLVNDWRLASGSPFQEELYGTIQTLRRLCVPFDLVPDGLATAETLDRFQLVIAPAYSAGLGQNARGEPIAEVLAKWLRGRTRRLVISHHPSLAATFGLRETSPPAAIADSHGPDMNVFIDVGAEGDEKFLRAGYSQRESWGRAPNPADPRSTFRWTPGVGNETSLLVPASTNRDHVLRVVGRAIWPNKITLVLNGREVKNVEMSPGDVRLEIAVPAAAIGAMPVAALDLRFADVNVPGKKAPATYPGEERVCNLMLESLQWSTANVAADTRKQQYTFAADAIRLAGETRTGQAGTLPYGGDVFGREGGVKLSAAVQPRAFFDTASTKILSVVERGNVPRDLLVPAGPSQVIYVNGPLSEIESETYWLPVVRNWAHVAFDRYAAGEHCMVNRLSAGDTDLVMAFNQDIAQARELRFSIPHSGSPLSEAAVLARDGKTYQRLDASVASGAVTARDAMRYYAVYQFAFSPVKVETPPLVLQPGERKKFAVRVSNLTSQPISGRIEPAAVIPTISGPPVPVALLPNESKSVDLEIAAAPTADWGRKTIYLALAFNNRRAVVFRDLVVEKPADVEVTSVVIDAKRPRVILSVPKNPYGATAALSGAKVTLAGRTLLLDPIRARDSVAVEFAPFDLHNSERPELRPETLRIELPEPRKGKIIERNVFLARVPDKLSGPPGAVMAAVVFNPRAKPLDKQPVLARWPGDWSEPLTVRTDAGIEVPCQPNSRYGGAPNWFLADVPARAQRTYYLCRGEPKATSDLRCLAEGLGTGKGTLKVENAKMTVVLSEAAGGTVTSFRSAKTGRDYGRKSFGINYGTFSKHDPANPVTNTVDFIQEQKVRQEDTPGQIEYLNKGPAFVQAGVLWYDRRIAVKQHYEFFAGQPYFKVTTITNPKDLKGEQELVVFNAQLQPHKLSKTYPDFPGEASDAEQPHFGWRMGNWVPDCAGFLAPPQFDESISLIAKHSGLKGIRQGFWPRERPKPGKREIGQIELLADTAHTPNSVIYVLLHEGHQIVAERFQADLALPPEVLVVENRRVNGELKMPPPGLGPAAEPAIVPGPKP